MSKYIVSGLMTISVHVTVEASSVKGAKDAAIDADVMQLCHQCASGSKSSWSTSGELDGAPTITEVELIEDRP